MLRVSLVVPVYKTYEFLQRLFNSASTKYLSRNIEWLLIFVDDSPEMKFDWSVLISNMEKVDHNFRSITVLKNRKNRGVTYSRNRAYCHSKSDFVVFFDSDDVFAKDGFRLLEFELLKLEEKNGILLLATDAGTSSQIDLESKDYHALLADYGHGERLVAVRKHMNALPFIGHFRGHELAGLLRFQQKTGFGVKTASSIIRHYLNDNAHSISKGGGLTMRLPMLMNGHLYTASFLLKHGKLLWATRFFATAFFLQIKIIVKKLQGNATLCSFSNKSK